MLFEKTYAIIRFVFHDFWFTDNVLILRFDRDFDAILFDVYSKELDGSSGQASGLASRGRDCLEPVLGGSLETTRAPCKPCRSPRTDGVTAVNI